MTYQEATMIFMPWFWIALWLPSAPRRSASYLKLVVIDGHRIDGGDDEGTKNHGA